MIKIRNEGPDDIPAIRRLNQAAFDGPEEALAVDMLRAAGKAMISLVAVFQGQVVGQQQIVGHILFSPITFDPPQPGLRALGLAPLGVSPTFQNQGIGSRLVREGLKRCSQAGYQVVAVLGHPNYYPRFGFQRASQYGLGNEYNVDEAFMALELEPGALVRVEATARYAPEFAQAGA